LNWILVAPGFVLISAGRRLRQRVCMQSVYKQHQMGSDMATRLTKVKLLPGGDGGHAPVKPKSKGSPTDIPPGKSKAPPPAKIQAKGKGMKKARALGSPTDIPPG